MGLLEKIKGFFGKTSIVSEEQVRRLGHLPGEQARRELAGLLYDHCVRRAGKFVREELQRGDSPYRGTAPAVLYDEIMAVTLWIMDREAAGGRQELLAELQAHYLSTFTGSGDRVERRDRLQRKFGQYEDSWNEITGHLDEFGLQVVKNIFGEEQNIRTRERTFWIIQYSDEAAGDFASVKKTWKAFGLRP
jgi:hypothetical protein